VRDEFLARLVLRPGERWLDLATCTGPIALRAARVAAHVSAQDLFLARGPRLAGAERLSVRFEIGDAERLPHPEAGAAAQPDRSPDGVRHELGRLLPAPPADQRLQRPAHLPAPHRPAPYARFRRRLGARHGFVEKWAPVIFEQHYLGCLAHASYLVADERSGIAAVVDPQRDVERYVDAARRVGCHIRHVFLTHFHADFVAGHLELRDREGAVIHLGARARAEYEFLPAGDGDMLELGPGVRIEVLETPGHSPESISLLVYDLARDTAAPQAVLTGDTLFVGDVGRPDLRASLGWSAEALGSMLYDSLRDKLLALPDTTLVYPAHGAGSLCGKNLGAETVSTIGDQRAQNYALQEMDRREFVHVVTADQPDTPRYFSYDAALNAREHPTLPESLERELRPLGLDDVLELQRSRAHVLDTRRAELFEAAHLAGSLNIGLEGRYATWCGTILDPQRPVAIITDPGREHEAATRLGRIGFDNVAGYLEAGMVALAARPDLVAAVERLAPSGLAERLGDPEPPVLIDVRTEREYDDQRIERAENVPLSRLAEHPNELAPEKAVVVYCSSGYRSAIAASLLLSRGFERVGDLAGGIAAWESAAADLPEA
jgi:hydroxyacylglutathione hydrolase